MEERRGLTIKDLLIRLILIIIFIFLLIWLFPMPDLKPLNNQIFADNVDRMKDVAKSYYTTERLPQNIGDSKKMTLREMIDNHLILPLMDSKGKTCNTDDSYVEITKMENEYVIKVNLSCTDQKDYVIEHFGCYDICSDTCKALEAGIEAGTTTYKTSSKATNAYTTRRTNRRTTTTTRKTIDWTSTKTNTKIYEYEFVRNVCNDVFDSYTCPTGYTLVGDSCMRYLSETETIPATKNISIISSVDSIPAKVESTSSTEKTDPITDYKTSTITAGYKASLYTATKKTVTRDVTADEYKSYDVKGAVATTKTTKASYNVYNVYDIVDANITYPDAVEKTEWKYVSTITTTDPGLAHIGATEKIEYKGTWQEPECVNCDKSAAMITWYRYWKYKLVTTISNGKPEYSCDKGYTLDGTKCKMKLREEKSCPDKFKDTGSGCIKESTDYSCSKYGSEYKFDSNNKVCKKTITTYDCPKGTTKTSDPKVCHKTTEDWVCPSNMEKQGSGSSATCLLKHDYYCPANTDTKTYTLNGTNCTVKTKVASCESGYTLSEDKKYCYKNNSSTVYSCEGYDDYTLEGDKCTKVINTEKITYSCSKEYTLDGTNCVRTIVENDTIKADKTYKTYCNQEYKWSTSTSLDGWSYTGNKRQIN